MGRTFFSLAAKKGAALKNRMNCGKSRTLPPPADGGALCGILTAKMHQPVSAPPHPLIVTTIEPWLVASGPLVYIYIGTAFWLARDPTFKHISYYYVVRVRAQSRSSCGLVPTTPTTR